RLKILLFAHFRANLARPSRREALRIIPDFWLDIFRKLQFYPILLVDLIKGIYQFSDIDIVDHGVFFGFVFVTCPIGKSLVCHPIYFLSPSLEWLERKKEIKYLLGPVQAFLFKVIPSR